MLIFKVTVAALAVGLVVSLVGGRLQLSRMQREYDTVSQRVQQQEEKNRELQEVMDSGDEDAYVERIAREKMGYARPGERIFIDITGEEEE